MEVVEVETGNVNMDFKHLPPRISCLFIEELIVKMFVAM